MTLPLGDRAIKRVAEDKIRAAMEAGAFDDLPGAGKPLPDLDEPWDEMWWIKRWIKREGLTGGELNLNTQERHAVLKGIAGLVAERRLKQ